MEKYHRNPTNVAYETTKTKTIKPQHKTNLVENMNQRNDLGAMNFATRDMGSLEAAFNFAPFSDSPNTSPFLGAQFRLGLSLGFMDCDS